MPEPTWRTTIKLHEAKGQPRDFAIKLVVIEWLGKGDPAPLLWAVAEGEITDPILITIVNMLTGEHDYRLTITGPSKLGAGEKPGLHWRNMIIAATYKRHRKGLDAAAAFRATASTFGVSEAIVRKAVTWSRQQVLDPTTGNKS